MNIKSTSNELLASTKDTMLLGIFEGEAKLGLAGLPDDTAEFLKENFRAFSFTGKTGQLISTRLPQKVNVISVGLGEKDKFTLNAMRMAIANAVKSANKMQAKEITFPISFGELFNAEETARAIVEVAVMALYKYDSQKSDREEMHIQKILIANVQEKDKRIADKAINDGIIIGEATITARELINTSPSIATPVYMADMARRIAQEQKLKLSIIDKPQLEKMGMNGILAVAAGSRIGPKLVVLEYDAGSEKTVALVGKGVCFDSGGLDIKPALYMEDMKMDKAGAIAVMSTMMAIAQLKPNVNVVGVMPFVENLVSDTSYKPGDIVKTMSGKTIEVLNTDAEGRVILSDALYYTIKEFNPECVIDLATLTGAVIIALGNNVAGVMSNDKMLTNRLIVAGTKTHERLWELPMFEDYFDLMKSDHADVKNVISNTPGNPAGTITGAVFLSHFVGEAKWAHLDIAGTAWADKEEGYFSRGATGFGVRLLCQFLTDYQ